MTTSTDTRRGLRFHDLVAEVKPEIKEIDAATLRQWQAENKDFVLIDTREAAESSQATIQNAVTIPRGVLELHIDDAVPDQDETIVLYCGGGNRSALAAYMIQKMGYTNVYSLAGGWRGWNQP